MYGSSESKYARKSSISSSSSISKTSYDKSKYSADIYDSSERRSSIVQDVSSSRESSISTRRTDLEENLSSRYRRSDVLERDERSERVRTSDKSGQYQKSEERYAESSRQIDGLAPTFQQKPAIKQEDDGKRLLFECRILADPKPTLSWFHNGNLVTPTGRFKSTITAEGKNVYFSVLEVGKVTVEDAGKYKVTAKNELGESNATISLNFDSDDANIPDEGVKPTFTDRPVIRQSDDGNKVIFECRLVADPTPIITWYQGTKVIKEGGKYKMKIETDTTKHVATMEISGVESGDGGEYKAVAKNKLGEGTANINLNFEGGGDDDKPKVPDGKAPRFPKKPTIKQEGDILIMECILECNPSPEIQWYRGTTKINESGDEGVAPTFIGKPKIIPKDNGALVMMECQVNSKPAPEVTWYKGTTVVRESSRIKTIITPNGDNYTVVMEIKACIQDFSIRGR
uniref:Ig-like domain-containing protein n=1 Tax=Strigamia maritima TaxID=126957 RepID=T1IZ97_STRMM